MKIALALAASAALVGLGWFATRPRHDVRAPHAAPEVRTEGPTPAADLPASPPIEPPPAERPQPSMAKTSTAKAPEDAKPSSDCEEVEFGEPTPDGHPLRGHPEESPVARALRETKISLELKNAAWGSVAEQFLRNANVPLALDQSIAPEVRVDLMIKDVAAATALSFLAEVLDAEWALVDQTVVIRKRSK